MTQENLTISVMLEKRRDALESVFGKAIIYEIENLFDLRAGPNLRHKLAHGMLTTGACYGHDARYACWFIFRLTCLPLFAHWERLTAAYEEL